MKKIIVIALYVIAGLVAAAYAERTSNHGTHSAHHIAMEVAR